MPSITLYPKDTAKGQLFGLATMLPVNYSPNKKYMLWIVGHGIGERGDGSVAALNKVLNWNSSIGEGWTNIKAAVDKYEFIAVFLNTSENYQYGEGLFALEWAKKSLPIDTSLIFYLGHSLGSYGAGRYMLLDDRFVSQLAGWLVSASGNFGDNPVLWKKLKDNNIRILGVTAENDTANGTLPIAVTRIGDNLLKLDPAYPVAILEFPDTIWSAKVAHNAVLHIFTADTLNRLSVSYNHLPGLHPFPTAPKFQMNIFQWALSNPKGSVPKMLTDSPGAVFDESTTTTTTSTSTTTTTTTTSKPMSKVTLNRVNVVISTPNPYKGYIIYQVNWDDKTQDVYHVAPGGCYFSDKSDRFDIQLFGGGEISIYKTKVVEK